jgi:hypothetical protein
MRAEEVAPLGKNRLEATPGGAPDQKEVVPGGGSPGRPEGAVEG